MIHGTKSDFLYFLTYFYVFFANEVSICEAISYFIYFSLYIEIYGNFWTHV